MLPSKVHAQSPRVVHRDKPEKEAIPDVVGDSPSERVTLPMSAIEGEDEDDAEDILEDDGDRGDGVNAAEANEQRALDELPADRPLVIDDEPSTRRDH